MSEIEAGYAERYLALVHRHFTNAVTGNIPERLGRLDEDEMGKSLTVVSSPLGSSSIFEAKADVLNCVLACSFC
jgi:hypothetical protein